MILAVDIGNSNIVIGAVYDDNVRFVSRMATDRSRTEDQYAISFLEILSLYKIEMTDFEGSIISSVVPSLTGVMVNAIKKAIGITPLIIGPGIKTGLIINTNNPAQLGSDIIVDNIAARYLFKSAVIVIDMGTATTISATDEKNTFMGCAIMPGVSISLNALTKNTSQLQGIGLENPKKTIGLNTADCMKSGIVYGNACMIDGMLDRFINELGYTPVIVATGGHSKYIIPYCRHKINYVENLLLTGLNVIYNLNKSSKRGNI